MDFNEYQTAARSTAVYPGKGEFTGLAYAALGLNGEAGEVAEKVKKLWRDHSKHNKRSLLDRLLRRPPAPFRIPLEIVPLLRKEIGDTLWYLSAAADEIGTTLEEVAEENIQKLTSRRDRDVLHGSGDER